MSTENAEDPQQQPPSTPAPRRRNPRRQAVDDTPAGSGAEEFLDSKDTEEMGKIAAILAELSADGGMIRLSRRGVGDKTFAHLENIPVADFDIEHIKTVYGGGDYKAQTHRSNGAMYRPFTFRIDTRFKGTMDVQSQPSSNLGDLKSLAEIIAPKTTGDGGAVQLMAAMMKAQTDAQTLAAERQSTFFTGMVTLVTAFVPVVVAHITKEKPPVDPLLLKLIEAKGSGSSVEDAMGMLVKAKELFGGNDQPEPIWTKILAAISPSFGPLASAVMNRKSNSAVSPPPSPSPVAELPAVADQSPIDNLFPILARAAINDSDPTTYVNLVLDIVPAEHVAALVPLLTGADWPVSLFGQDEEKLNVIKAHISWFTELRDGIVAELRNPTPPEGSVSGDQHPDSD